jgi:hypothetical protein
MGAGTSALTGSSLIHGILVFLLVLMIVIAVIAILAAIGAAPPPPPPSGGAPGAPVGGAAPVGEVRPQAIIEDLQGGQPYGQPSGQPSGQPYGQNDIVSSTSGNTTAGNSPVRPSTNLPTPSRPARYLPDVASGVSTLREATNSPNQSSTWGVTVVARSTD